MSHSPNIPAPAHRKCFLLEPYDRLDTAQHKLNNMIHDEIVFPATDAHNFRIVRASQVCRPGFVTREHLRLATECDLVVANLSGFDPVVYYCLAARLEALDTDPFPTITLLHEAEDLLIEKPLKQAPVPYRLPKDIQGLDTLDETARQEIRNARQDVTKAINLAMEGQSSWAEQNMPAANYPKASPPHQPSSGPASPDAPLSSYDMADKLAERVISQLALKHNRSITERLTDALLNTGPNR